MMKTNQNLRGACIIIGSIVLLATVVVAGASDTPYPDSVEVRCGKLNVRLGAATFWNMNRIEYDKLPISADLAGAYWGTVCEFPELGFLGSGHKGEDGRSEKVLDIKMFSDGKLLSPEDVANLGIIKCAEFRMEKKAQIENIVFDYVLVIKNDRLIESCALNSSHDIALKLMYNFMHPWSEEMTDFYIQINGEKSKQGTFAADNKFPHQDKFTWVAIYDKNIEAGVVSKASGDDVLLFLWDRGVYKKCYLCSFFGKTMKSGEDVSYSMTTDFFKASPDAWLDVAKEKASQL